MKNESLVSVIMPAYNAAAFIKESIASVRDQSYGNWELLVINDGSTDETAALVEELRKTDQRIKSHSLPVNQGAGFARNVGIKASKGEFIAFLDADDLWKPHKLKTQLDFMRARDLAVSFSSYELIKENGESLHQMVKALERLTFSKLLLANYIGNLTGMYHTAKIGKIYNPPIRKRQDWALWLQAIKRGGDAEGIQEPLAKYRVRKGSISGNKWEMLQYNYQVYRKVLQFSNAKSGLWFSRFLIEQFFVKSKQLVKLK